MLPLYSCLSFKGPALARVLEDFEAQNPGELALWKNGVVTILEEGPAGWYKGDLNGKSGLFPADVSRLYCPFGMRSYT